MKMKIGITCYPTYGGSGVVATELGKELAHRGHSVHFISYALPMRLSGFQDNIVYHEVEMSNYPLFEFPLYTLALASKMVEVARYEKLDILHCHYALPHATSAYLAKQILARYENKNRHDTSRDRYHISRSGTEFFADYEVQHRTKRRRYRGLAVPQGKNTDELRHR